MEPVLRDEMRDRPVTRGALFAAFLKVSLYGFGGPLVWARRVLVEERHWLSDVEFAEILSFCQFLPGPNVVSMTVCVGAKFQGVAGALAALAGFVLIPWTLGFAIGTVVLSYAQTALLQGIYAGLPPPPRGSSSLRASGFCCPIAAARLLWPSSHWVSPAWLSPDCRC